MRKESGTVVDGIAFRDAVEESFPNLNWEATREERKKQQRHFDHGWWEGTLEPMHEGGRPFGMVTHVIHAWRESVDPTDDVPIIPHPLAEPQPRSESFTRVATGKKIFGLSGRIWVKHWISPAQKSPRIRRDDVEARIHFQVENQERATLAGKALHDYWGWLWFKPSVIPRILKARTSEIKWYTAQTGEVGPAPHATLHFGTNRLGLVNVLGYKMAQLPEWAQKYWASSNVGPEGGLSEELHMSQNLATPADTIAPEAMLWNNLEVLQSLSAWVYGRPLLRHFPSEHDFLHRIHRFYCESFAEVCELCKELHRIVSEPIDVGLLNEKVDVLNARKANEADLRPIKRVALWLDTIGLNGRDSTRALAAVYELRIADAHIESSHVRDALKLLGVAPDTQNYIAVCYSIIGQVANAVGTIADAIKTLSPEMP